MPTPTRRGSAPANLEPDPSVAPFIPSRESRFYIMVGMGAIGGFVLGRAAYKHFFVEGVTDEERRGIMTLAACGAAVLAAKQFFDIDEKWFSGEGVAEVASQALTKINTP